MVAVVTAFVRATRTLNDVSSLDLCLTLRKIGEKNLFGLTVLARETEIPLSGVKGTHVNASIRFPNGREDRGYKSAFSYKARGQRTSRRINPNVARKSADTFITRFYIFSAISAYLCVLCVKVTR